MEEYKDFSKKICRVCLSQENPENMVPLTDISCRDGLSFYGKAVLTFANISIKNDYLPLKMCQNCLFLLKQAIVFKKRCELSHETLQKVVQKYKSSPSDVYKELSQYVVLRPCMPVVNLQSTRIVEKTCRQVKKKRKEKKQLPKEESDSDDCFLNIIQSNFLDNDESVDESLDQDELLKQMEALVGVKSTQIVRRSELKLKSENNHNQQNKLLSQQQMNKKRERLRQQKRLQNKRRAFVMNMNRHRESQHMNILCKICNKVLSTRGTYKSHMERHTHPKSYICELCAKGYSSKAELHYHLASTHDIGPHHICKVCGFKAPRRFDLIEHERLHTGERPFTCEKCGLTFRRRFIWKRHALYHQEKTVECPNCLKKFHTQSGMLAHCNNVHERKYVYACNECDERYAKPATVRRHLVDKHGIGREVQGKITKIKLAKINK